MRGMPDASSPARGATHPQRVWAEIDPEAIARNVERFREAAPQSVCCAVVKADGYGHGAVTAARAAIAGGATWLAVATAAEATELRAAGITERLLVLGPLTPRELDEVLAADADLVAWTHEVLDAAAARGGARVHVKLDTGMGRLGTRDPQLAMELLRRCAEDSALEAAGVMTHFATADELGDLFFAEQRDAFLAFVEQARQVTPGVIAHAANSAAVLRDSATHLDMIRPGVGVYGLDPYGSDPGARGLTPALALRSTLGAVKPILAGQSTGYGRRWTAEEDGYVGIIPLAMPMAGAAAWRPPPAR